MSRLGNFELDIIARLESAEISAAPAFESVTGASGGWRAAHREAIFREHLPAAYVAFIEEPCAPEVREAVRGAKFAIFIAARTLRAEADPRHGDVTTTGAFALIDAARAVLDDFEIDESLRLVCVHAKFVEADGRGAIYELLYRVWPVVVVEEPPPALTFDGAALAGEDSIMTLEMGPLNAATAQITYHQGRGLYTRALDPFSRTIIWRGELIADSHSALTDIETAIDAAIVGAALADIEEYGIRTLEDCQLIDYFREGGRFVRGGQIVQKGELLFEQKLV